MKKIAQGIVRFRKLILTVAFLLLIPSAIGAVATRINYDILTYLPQDLDSMIGEVALEDDFHLASTGMITVEGLPTNELIAMKKDIETVPGVMQTFWLSDVIDPSIPTEMLPADVQQFMFGKNDSTMLIVRFDAPSASDETMNAVSQIETLLRKDCFFGGMSVILQDTKALVNQEMPLYILIAVGASLLVLFLSLESTITPLLFMLGLLFPIAYNFGTNIFLGQISYITEALATVLQLGVTMDFSIFLLHRYQEEKELRSNNEEAMVSAICKTMTSISASSLTTIAGFLALCAMRLTLGRDIGIVMAKGVVLGVATVILVLPSLVLIFDKQITKHKHKSLMPSFDKVNSFILRHNKAIMVIFVLLFIPAYYAQSHAGIYYKLDESLPRDLPSIVSNEKLKNDFDMATSHFIVLRDDLNPAEMSDIENRMEEVKGVTSVVSYHKMLGTGIPDFFIPNEVKDMLKQGGYQLMMVNSSYSPATDAVSAQLDEMTAILKQYDENAMITGEGAMYRDLIDTTAVDFVVANYLSIACIFIIVAWAFKSITVPAVLVATIELAIFLNQGFSYFSGASTPFIAPTIISCVQLGATVDYAILMTSRFQEELQSGKNRKEAIRIAADSADASIVTSALVMFCATLGVSFVSSIDLIGAICIMLARGALISACICLFVMPAVLYVCEPMFNKTTLHWRTEQPKKESKAAKALKAASEKLPARKEKAALPEKGTEQTETTEPAEAADSTKLAAESETEADAVRETANV